MECYGTKYGKLEKCSSCEMAQWCRDAGDIPLSHQTSYDEAYMAPTHDDPTNRLETADTPEVPTGQWMEVLRRILEIDDRECRLILRLKIENPDISLAALGRRFGITKQAVDKRIRRICAVFPELRVILRNRPSYNRWRSHSCHKITPRSAVRRAHRDYYQPNFEMWVDDCGDCKKRG